MTSFAGDARPFDDRFRSGPDRRAPIVVGVEDTTSGLDAVDWAASEAAISDRPLRLVHAWSYPAAITTDGFRGAIDAGYYQVDGEDILSEAAQQARAVAPEVDIATQSVMGPAGEVLRQQSTAAHLLVLGGCGRPWLGGLLRGAVSIRTTLRFNCPVVVVRPYADLPSGPSATRVVVGVDVAAPSGAALRYAFAAAAQRRIGVTAVHATMAALPDDTTADHVRLERILAEYGPSFPAVGADAKVIRSGPVEAIVGESAGAALTVVGPRKRGYFSRALLDSVSRTVLRCAQSPVAIPGPRC